MIGRHRVSAETFAALATADGDAHAVEVLRNTRLSKHLLLLKFVVSEWPGDPAERDRAVSTLAEAQAHSPETISRVLGEPMIGSWVTCVSRRIRGTASSKVPLCIDLGHLGAIAAAAALASEVDADLTGYARGGRVMLPGLGAVRLPGPDAGPVPLRVRGGSVTAGGNGRTVTTSATLRVDSASWYGMRRLTADAGGSRAFVALDDLDPYRDRHHIPATDRIPANELPRWEDTFAQAWTLLACFAPARAEELAAGLRSLVPLAAIGDGPARSATARDAFGSFGLTAPVSPTDLAITLVHEFSHSKLSALLDLVPLYDPDASERHYAPWRLDPRPIGGLFQGVYAFVAVADTWRSLCAAPDLAPAAIQEFADLREQVNHALGLLRGSAALTPHGRRFAAGLQDTMDRLMAEPLPADTVKRARDALARNHQAWRARNA